MKSFETRKKVLIIGDIMLDRYLFGTVTRISPEAPVPVLDYRETDHRLGGAANVALNLLGFDADVFLISIMGRDEEGDILRKILEDNNIPTTYLVESHTRRTTLKTRVMASNHQLLRVDREDKDPLSVEDEGRVKSVIEESISILQPDGIVLQDYNKGMLTPEVIRYSIALAQENNIPVFVDPKTANTACYSHCTVFKPNLKEAETILGYSIQLDEAGLSKAAEDLQKITIHELTMITLSDRGMYLKRKEGQGIYIDAIKQKVSDVCGAGDTVISTLTIGYLSGYSDRELGLISNLAGHIVCRFPGVVPIDVNMLKSEMIFI
ncbi:bifunctional heptose 7-phosphate kinase/heptose 1-phosphate adenyltransferase [Membranihabitans marinus]|uniref:bifunctional heptose 7-phosphate kinase/heptose 1-phosphate adenyltransferase n=1 Tax=Membranihabitans marinus TaxID=1227546 RepID=UPI001F2FF272|nr:PfkB family carbohydrate kinase [Membranihabitans marinus]